MGESAHYLVTYDITDDRMRSSVSDLLESEGLRVQKSVFECKLDRDGVDRLAVRLGRLIRDDIEADIRIYRLCDRCMQESFGFGETEPVAGGEPWLIA